jgi:hypothetical protein
MIITVRDGVNETCAEVGLSLENQINEVIDVMSKADGKAITPAAFVVKVLKDRLERQD